MDEYEIVERIGEGTFGEVSKARKTSNGQVVALKRVRIRTLDGGIPANVFREMQALRLLRHPNVVHLFDAFPHGSAVVLVMEYMTTDLHEMLRSRDSVLRDHHVKGLALMLLRGLAHCHSQGVMHRDVKPSNLLLGSDGVLKLGDFGLARAFRTNEGGEFTHQVATRWYRAPELLFGARQYGPEVDMWAVGTVLAEMLASTPLFPGENDIDQIFRVVQVLGTPSAEEWPEATKLPDFGKIAFPDLRPIPLRNVLPNAPEDAVDLVARLLRYRPSDRLSAEDALKHPFFFSEPLPAGPGELPVARVAVVDELSGFDVDAPCHELTGPGQG